MTVRHLSSLCALAAWALGLGLLTSPWVQPAGADRELYRYVGMLWSQGYVPYANVFDIKPPLIFLAALGGSRWGLWAVVNICVAAAAGAFYQTCRRERLAYPTFNALLWLGLMRLPYVVEGGGLSFELSAAFVMLVVCAVRARLSRGFGVGLLTGLVAMTQQSDILALAPPLGYAVYESLARRPLLRDASVGAACVLLPMLGYFGWHHALGAWVYDTWLFPFGHYVAHLWQEDALMQALSRTELLPILAWVLPINLAALLLHRASLRFTFMLLISLALQTTAASLSGKFYGHYFLSFTVYLVWLAALAQQRLGDLWRRGPKVYRLGVVCAGVLFAWLCGAPVQQLIWQAKTAKRVWQSAQADGISPYERSVNDYLTYVRQARGQPGQVFVFRAYGAPLAVYTELAVRAPTPWVHTLFWGNDAGRDADELEDIIASLETAHTRYVFDFSLSKPLPSMPLQARWNSFVQQHYLQSQALPCVHQQGLCGWLYVRGGD